MDYTGTNHYLSFVNANVYDTGGNNNSRLDPGETANLTSILRNIGGANFTNLQTTLQCTSPYITITDNSGYFGGLAVDSINENTTDPYTVSVNVNCPQGHNAVFKLITIDGTFSDTFTFSKVVGSYHYLVWNPDVTPSSGQTIHNTLATNGYTGSITTNLLGEPTLEVYRSIFICCGVYSNNYRIPLNGAEATAIINYLNSGGRVYLEGGEVWYYDPQVGGHNFGTLFGIIGVSDGSNDMGPVIGQDLTFSQGMYFNYSGENNYMDHINASAGYVVFKDQNNAYNCGVAYNQGTYRTIGTSFELGGLVDDSGVSTKAILLDSIMKFFGISLASIEEQENEHSRLNDEILNIYPSLNRAGEQIKIQYVSLIDEDTHIKIYNISGRCVRNIIIKKADNQNHIYWNGTDDNGFTLAAGVYFVNLTTTIQTITKHVVLVD